MCKRIIITLMMLLCTVCLSCMDVNASMKQGDKEITYIYFGNYWQTDTSIKEPIEWELGGITNNIACLHSAKCLEYMVYDDVWSSKSTWANSKCRKWLNSDFLNSAFNTNEKNQIITKLPGGYRQQDLSTVYLSGYFHGVPVKATNYALRKHPGIGPYVWWVVDISFGFGTEGRKVAYSSVNNLRDGTGKYVGYLGQYQGSTLSIWNELYGMRPCIYIDISKGGWKTSRYKRINPETQEYEYYKIDYAGEDDEVGVETNDTEYINRVEEDSNMKVSSLFLEYNIQKPSVKIAKRAKNKAVIQWKKTDDSTSYDLWYSTSKKFAKKKTKKIKLTKTKYTIKKLNKKKKYYVKVRGKLKVDRISANGKWSKVKVIKRK